MLLLETSPGTEQAIGLIRPRVFEEDDRAGVVGFARTADLLQPLTEDRGRLGAALQRAGVRVGIAVGGPHRRQLNSNLTADLVGALRKAADEFEQRGSDERKRAIVVYFAGDDRNLSANLDILKTMLSSAEAQLYAVVVQRTDGPRAQPIPGPGVPPFPIPAPVMTVQLMSELTKESGGRIYKRSWDLRKVLAEARKR